MNPHPGQTPDAYLRTKVLTASPQELRLMLYDGAIKFCRQARHALARRDLPAMYAALLRAQQVVMELGNSLNHHASPELCSRLAALYNYIHRRLVDANMERDVAAVDEAIRLLEFQRETWTLAMKKLQQQPDPAAAEPAAPAVVTAEAPNPIATIGPRAAAAFAPAAATTSRFSVEG